MTCLVCFNSIERLLTDIESDPLCNQSLVLEHEHHFLCIHAQCGIQIHIRVCIDCQRVLAVLCKKSGKSPG